MATVRYGRVGSRLRLVAISAESESAMRQVVRDRLRRRMSAPRRIGCAYQLMEAVAAPGLDTAAWVPDGLVHEDP